MNEDIHLVDKDKKQGTANPFPGLRPFKIDESHLFFGREGQSDEVLLKLSKNRFVGVIGPSGSGKSSFVYCGVLPILYGGFLTQTGPNWEVIVSRPGAAPIDNLANAFLEKQPEYLVADEEEKQIKRTIISTFLKSSSLGLVEAVKQTKRGNDKNYLILIDQFEELFRFKKSAKKNSVNETLAFVSLLVEAASYADIPIYVGITMRSDFIGECAQFPELTKKINDSHYLIPQLTREQKRKAITGPIAVGGADIAPRLTQQLLNDLGDNPDQLPILQHALMRTWSYWQKYEDPNKSIDLKHYEAIGTMTEALSMHANEAFDELNEEQQHICQSLFKAITEKRGENNGIRRPTTLGEVASIANVPIKKVAEVVEKFREPSRSLLTPSYLTPLRHDSIIDISHESLMRIWVRLSNWVNEESEAVQMYLRLSDAAAMYQVGKAGLWRPPDLQLALNWKDKHKPTLVWGQRYNPAYERTMTFLDYSKREFETEQRIKEMQQKRRLRLARIVALIMASMLIVSIFFLVYALDQQSQAQAQEQLAKEAQKNAEQKAIEANQEKERANTERQKALDATKKAEYEADNAKRAQKLATDREKQARISEAKAQENFLIAEEQKRIAQARENDAKLAEARALDAKDLAEKNEQKAKLEKERGDRLRYLAIAKAMAVKSTQIRKEQADLKGLLAMQAYNYNDEYDGDNHDHDIYSGLYYALKEFEDPMVTPMGGYSKAVKALVTNTNGNVIYSGGSKGKILKWRLEGDVREADTLIKARSGHIIRTMAVNHDNTVLVAGGDYPVNKDSTTYAEIFLLGEKNQNVTKIKGIRKELWQVQYNRTKDQFYLLDNEGKSLRIYKNGLLTDAFNFKERINKFHLGDLGNEVFVVTNSGKLIKYDVGTQNHHTIFTSSNKLLSLSYSSHKNMVIVGDNTGIITLIHLDDPSKPRELIGHISPINQIKFSHTGQFVATASSDRAVRLWNMEKINVQPLEFKDHQDWVWAIAFTPDENKLIAGTQNKQIMAWPTDVEMMSQRMCQYLRRQFTEDEWKTYVAEDINLVNTCK